MHREICFSSGRLDNCQFALPVTSADLGGSGRMERSLHIRSPTPYVESTPGSPMLLAAKLLDANFLQQDVQEKM